MKSQSIVIILAAACSAFAQNSAIVTSAGYSAPASFQAAPGQIVTLFVRGVTASSDGTLRFAEVAGLPVLSLAGISVAITQAGSAVAAPLFAVRQQNDCANPTSNGVSCILTAIKLQVPFELNGDVQVGEGGQVTFAPAAQVMVNVDGNAGRGFPLQLFPDNGHILTTCDLTWDTGSSSTCNRQVYHADGTVVDQQAPAKAGEAVSVYFYGLGQTSPAAQTGAESPVGAAITDLLGHPRVSITFRNGFVNANNSTPRIPLSQQPEGVAIPVDSAGLFRGQIGIYQVNFTLPSVTPDYPCGGTARTNALLTIGTSQGAEVVGVCFQ